MSPCCTKARRVPWGGFKGSKTDLTSDSAFMRSSQAVRSPDRRPSTCRRMFGWLCDRFNNQSRVHRCHGKHPPKRTAAKPRTNLIAVQGTISADQSSAIRLIPVWNIQLVRSRAKVPWLLTETARALSPNLSTSHHLPRLYLVVPIAISVGGGSVLGRAVLPAADSPGPKDRAVDYMVGCKGPPIGSSLSERCPRCRS